MHNPESSEVPRGTCLAIALGRRRKPRGNLLRRSSSGYAGRVCGEAKRNCGGARNPASSSFAGLRRGRHAILTRHSSLGATAVHPRAKARGILAKPSKDSFRPLTITHYTLGQIKKLEPLYERILLGVLDAILKRYERNPGYYFIDTKLNVITGKDFGSIEEEGRNFRGKNVIYAWIQGRGLEALAGHARWLKSCSLLSSAEKENRIKRIKKMLREVMTQMETIRRKNGGRLFFCFNPGGKLLEVVDFGKLAPLTCAIPSGSNFSDLFYAKGLLAAASYLNDSDKAKEALQYLRRMINDIENENFYSDQQPFDPKNKVRHVPGQHRQGQWMIALSALALAGELTGERWCFEAGERFIRHLIGHHLNLGQFPQLEKYDFFESADDAGQPWVEGGKIISDPGHALEFTGLAAKLLLVMNKKGAEKRYAELFSDCRQILPEVFRHNFRLGFNKKTGGICKAFDLIGRKPLNSDLPWWNLPETMRAGIKLLALGISGSYHHDVLKIIVFCSNSLLNNYVNPKVHFMTYQTRNAKGRVIDVIPATPDADPGYHTGLSIIDFLEIIGK